MTSLFNTERRRAIYQRGRWAEQAAVDYLKQQGLRLLDRNYRAPCGEIDIVMLDDRTLVFVEVRYRSDESFCRAIETISSSKQQRIRATAEHYLQQHSGQADCRFDVLTLGGPHHSPIFDWTPNAF